MIAPRVLVAHATKHGSTREVAEAVATVLSERGLEAEVRPAGTVDRVEGYAAVLLGGALYMGRWHPDALRLLRRNRAALARVPVAVYAMGPRTLEPKEVAESRAQLDRALAKTPEVEPIAVAIFGGVVDPSWLRFPLNRIPASDARDWHAIRRWAEEVAALIRPDAKEVA